MDKQIKELSFALGGLDNIITFPFGASFLLEASGEEDSKESDNSGLFEEEFSKDILHSSRDSDEISSEFGV